MESVYLDNNATTKPDSRVVAAVMRFLEDDYGNPSSVHRMGQRARAAVDHAREQVATLVGCRDRDLTFTGSGTEATNWILRGFVRARKRPRLVISTVEHDATDATANRVTEEGGAVTRIGVDASGNLDLDAFRDALQGDDVAAAGLIWANNETGVIFDVASAAEACREHGVPLHLDATQCAGKVPVDLLTVGCDAATFSPHKLHGPKGVGVAYLRRGVRLPGLIVGGPQERDRRGGTENVAGIVGAGVAADIARDTLPEMLRVAALRDALEAALLVLGDVRINGADAPRLPNTTNVAFKGLQAEALLLMLSEAGVCASAGAACSSGSLDPSRVLLAMNVPEPWAFGSIRLSLSRLTTEADVTRALDVFSVVVPRLRRVMPTAGV